MYIHFYASIWHLYPQNPVLISDSAYFPTCKRMRQKYSVDVNSYEQSMTEQYSLNKASVFTNLLQVEIEKRVVEY